MKLLQQDIKFLNNCKKSNIVPVHCKLGGRRDASPTTNRLLRNTERKFLSKFIAKCYSNRWKACKILQKNINQLEDTLSIYQRLLQADNIYREEDEIQSRKKIRNFR